MHSLSVWDSEYASLYAHCVHHFPNVAWDFPKLDFRLVPTLATSYNFQTVPPPTPMPMPAWSAPAPAAPPPSSFFWTPRVPPSSAPPLFHPHPYMEGCVFCLNLGHQIHFCPVAQEYISTGCAKIMDDRMHLPNGRGIPNDGLGRGLKAGIDDWLAAQSAPSPSAPICTAFVYDSPPHLDHPCTPSACIEEVVESNLLQILAVTELEIEPVSNSGEDLGDVFNIFTAERWKKHDDRATKLPELASPTPPIPSSLSHSIPDAPSRTPTASKASPQYHYHSDAKDQHVVMELQSLLLEGKLSLTTPAHVFAASPSIRQDICNKLKVKCIKANWCEPGQEPIFYNPLPSPSPSSEPEYSLPLVEIDVVLSSGALVPSVLDTGSPIVVISQDLCYDSTPIFPPFLTHVASRAISSPCHLPRAPSMCLQITGFILAYVALTCIILFAHTLIWFLTAVPRLLITFL
jgi:hypothetical protein